jgi:hypothetical protein
MLTPYRQGVIFDPSGGGAAITLADLSDVAITSVGDDELLQYDSASGEWINRTTAEIGLPLISGTPADNQVAVFTGAQGIEGAGGSFPLVWDGDQLGIDTSPISSFRLTIRDDAGASILTRTASATAAVSPNWRTERAKGSFNSPAGVESGDRLFQWLLAAFVPSDDYRAAGVIQLEATGTWGAAARGSEFQFKNTKIGGTSIFNAVVLTDLQNLLVGVAAAPGAGSDSLILGEGTAPSSLATNTAAYYAEDDGAGTVKPTVQDDAGGTAALTPHAPEHAARFPTDPYPGGGVYTQPHLGLRRIEHTTLALSHLAVLSQAAGLLGVGETYIEDQAIPFPTRDWHADQRRSAERAMAEYERHEARAAAHASREADHAAAVTAWEALPSVEDTRRTEWEALPVDGDGDRYRLAEAMDDSGEKVRVRVKVDEPPARELRREDVAMVGEDGRTVRGPHLRERPPAPEPLDEAPPSLPVVKEPPDYLKDRMIALGRWDQRAHDALVAEVENWKATR